MKQVISKWLNDKFADLQKETGKRWTITEFAEYLGCRQPQVSRWLNAQAVPEPEYIEKLSRLGDEIYDLVDLPRPDPDLRFISQNWHKVPQRKKKQIVGMIEEEVNDGKQSETPDRAVAPARR